MMKNLIEIISRNIKLFPDKKILFSDVTEYTYSDIDRISEKTAGFLIDSGLIKNEIVGILGLNSPEYVAAAFGIWKAGGVVTPLNYSLKPDELTAIIQKTKLRFIFVDELFLKNEVYHNTISENISSIIILRRIEKKNRLYKYIDFNDLSPQYEILPKYLSEENDTALCIFTSGTTGEPKGVELTHKNLCANIDSMQYALIFQENDILLNALPMFHVFSFTSAILLELYKGACVYVMEKFTPKQALDLVARKKITILLGVPAMLKLLIICKQKEKTDTSSLRVVISGGAALDGETYDTFKNVFGLYIHEGFGITEASPVCALNPVDSVPVKNSIGKPLRNVELRIIDENSNECPVGTPGELIIRGKNIMKGYYDDIESTKAAFIDDWYKSGDIAIADKNGND